MKWITCLYYVVDNIVLRMGIEINGCICQIALHLSQTTRKNGKGERVKERGEEKVIKKRRPNDPSDIFPSPWLMALVIRISFSKTSVWCPHPLWRRPLNVKTHATPYPYELCIQALLVYLESLRVGRGIKTHFAKLAIYTSHPNNPINRGTFQVNWIWL